MYLSKSTLTMFLKTHLKPKYIDNTFFNRSKEEKVVSKYYKDLLMYKKAFIPSTEAAQDIDIYFDDTLSLINSQ